jgi:glycogen phosphorylase
MNLDQLLDSIGKKGMDAASIQKSFAENLKYRLAKDQYSGKAVDHYLALSLATRNRLIEKWLKTQQQYYDNDVKRAYYLSAEFLMGRMFTNNLIGLGIYDESKKAMEELGLDINVMEDQEPDMGLGNGGLGRLAACFLDSMATMEIPSVGYGIRYEFGIFDQEIRDMGQVELPDHWLKTKCPWEVEHPEYAFEVKFFGRVNQRRDPRGNLVSEWVEASSVIGVAFDIPIVGYGNNTVNTLRLWSARASREFDLNSFQGGDYQKAVEEKNISENISKVLYPRDDSYEGKELRLKQQFFFVSCSIQDIIRRYLINHKNFDQFPNKVVIQMNDTHPTLTIPELMRLLLDEHGLSWGKAWDITTKVCAYTNHTLLSEALERWSLSIFDRLLPRHLQIIYEINRRFMRDVSLRFLNDENKMRSLSIIEEGDDKKVRMANLAVVGSFSVNGVAALHSQLLKDHVLHDFYQMYPEKFNNKTNGITPRRWLKVCNPKLSALITEKIGKGWIKNLDELKKIAEFKDDKAFVKKWMEIKLENKIAFAETVRKTTGHVVDPNSIFDVQVKRIHEYKRQLLNIIHVVYCWIRLKEDPTFKMLPRTFFFGGKAAPGYYMAKQIIRLICHVSEMVNRDITTNANLKVVFLPNYRVSLAEEIFPASDVSEQISTAGLEASGTGNMKFALNGALTIGTLDGANIEIMEEVGRENIFIFGLETHEVTSLRSNYNPKSFIKKDPYLQKTIDMINEGFFCPEEVDLFKPIIDCVTGSDYYMLMADFASYHECQMKVDTVYKDPIAWTKKAILNVAKMGKFSSDRTIGEYNHEIWKAKPLSIKE